ncbi:MAG: acetate/propionate family kinase [Candidatus Eisenbacteria sp.]|nr:acetate/propionate family kinase [Candidatus Eisenbacteria bacterium]
MKVLILNGGSSSLKYHLLDMDSGRTVLEGTISNLGLEGCHHTYTDHTGRSRTYDVVVADHERALKIVFDSIEKKARIPGDQLGVVGHRVVHGGERFQGPVIIDAAVEEAIAGYSQLAPLHNPVNLRIIRAARAQLPGATHVAVFDTAFHNTVPDYASVYGIPYEYCRDDHVRRYGFHGNSHEYVALRASQYLERPLRRLKLITCHLGNGASVCAIDRGRSIDTSMGFTPLEGLVMGTRCGDVDPAVITYLAREKQLSLDAIDNMLNKESGLLGISGISSDMLEVQRAAEEGDPRALLAIKMFCYRVKKYIGCYMLALGWVNAIVFTGGIGERSRGIRSRILQNTEKLGLGISEQKNRICEVDRGHPAFDISHRSSRARVLVVATNEELMMARKCLEAIDYDRTTRISTTEAIRQIPIGISAHHVHLCRADVDELFGKGHRLTEAKPLSQPGQFACEEKVDLVGPRGTVKGVRILGPERRQSQVEISRTEEFKLGVDAPVRESGDLEGTPWLTLVGPKGRVKLAQGVICAKRHIHMTPEDAELFAVSNGDQVMVRVTGEGRELIFGDVVIRVNKDYALEMHIDTDEANAAELSAKATGVLVSIQQKKDGPAWAASPRPEPVEGRGAAHFLRSP